MKPWEVATTPSKKPWELGSTEESSTEDPTNSEIIMPEFEVTKPTVSPDNFAYNTDTTSTIDPAAQDAYERRTSTISEAEDAKAKVENIRSRYSTMLKQVSGIWSPEDRESAEADMFYLKSHVLKEMEAQGFMEPRYDGPNGELMISVDGDRVVAEPGLLKTMLASKGEITTGLTAAALATLIPGPPWAKRIYAGAGGMLGASLGAGADGLINQVGLVNDLEDKVIYDKMIDAGIADAFFLTIGQVGVTSAKYMAKVYDYVVKGNMNGAYKAALEHYNVTEDQAREIVSRLEKVVGEIPGNEKEKALVALARTQAGGQDIAYKANLYNPSASANLSKSIRDTAENVRVAVDNLATDNVQQIVNQGLNRYTTNVKNFYRDVKEAPAKYMEGYQFDYDSLGVMPLAERIGARIENPMAKQRYEALLTKIGDTSLNRSFTDLIDLRQTVNEIKFASKSISHSDRQALDAIIKSIDTEISTVGKQRIPEYDQWATSWATAKSEYSQMKQLEKNVLYKALTKPGIDEQQVVKALSKYISAGDNTFYEVVEKLPKGVRNKVDGSILKQMVSRFSVGSVGESQAIHFPLLAEELGKVSWKNSAPEVQKQVRNLKAMGDLFRNDAVLNKVSGRIEIPAFQTYLTDDPVVRVRYWFASKVFNYVSQLKPGPNSNAVALIKNTGKLLENPINAANIAEMGRSLPKDRRIIREPLDFSATSANMAKAFDMEDPSVKAQVKELQNQFMERQAIFKEVFGKEAPARLVWKQPREPEVNVLDSVDEVLYATTRGTVAKDPSTAMLHDNAEDILIEHLWRKDTSGRNPNEITDRAMEYFNNNRYENIVKQAEGQLVHSEAARRSAIINDIVEREAKVLISRIEKDLGIKLPAEEADKLVLYKLKQISGDCK
jgi:hypothetical protein